MKLNVVLRQLKSMADPEAVKGMARFGISAANTLGVSIPALRKMAREIGKDHELALQLWDSGIHEARLLAGFIDDPAQVTDRQLEEWAEGFDSWDVCDQACSNLFDKTDSAWQKAVEWSARPEEFVKRAGFALMAALAVHDKAATDRQFEGLFPLIKREAGDERNYVRKAVNWALRQIGKRNVRLNRKAIKVAQEIRKMDSKSARWIAADALRELASPAVQGRLA